jgi:predicted  nucleic acid-binding Zn-ribbon protein
MLNDLATIQGRLAMGNLTRDEAVEALAYVVDVALVEAEKAVNDAKQRTRDAEKYMRAAESETETVRDELEGVEDEADDLRSQLRQAREDAKHDFDRLTAELATARAELARLTPLPLF